MGRHTVSTEVDRSGRVTTVTMEVDDMLKLARATGDDDPRAALAAARELRRAADRTEAAVVRRARNQGLAWAEIAEQLGVSRQAVHKKYGRRQSHGGSRGPSARQHDHGVERDLRPAVRLDRALPDARLESGEGQAVGTVEHLVGVVEHGPLARAAPSLGEVAARVADDDDTTAGPDRLHRSPQRLPPLVGGQLE